MDKIKGAIAQTPDRTAPLQEQASSELDSRHGIQALDDLEMMHVGGGENIPSW